MLSENKEKKVALIVVASLLLISSLAIVSFAMRPLPQESAERRAKEAVEQKEKSEMKEAIDRETRELKEALERETNPEIRAKLEARLLERERGYAMGRREAQRMKEFRGAGLDAAKWAKITMDQAVQIARSQNPGAVIQASLFGVSEDKVAYEIEIVTADENVAHVIVSAIDGTILKTKKELPRKLSEPE